MDPLDVSSLPPGFGFHPTDVELVSHYLKKKILGVKFELEVIPEVDIYKHEPWDLPGKTRVQSRDGKWHFFNTRDRKYPNGFRSNRATEAGYWKSTGKDRIVRSRNRVIGTKKTLVFHKGRPPSGKRTDWIMHEYYLNDSECKAIASGDKDLFVLCRITKRNTLATEDDDLHTHVEVKSDPCTSGGNESPADAQGSASFANAQDMPTLENINCEDWIRELYDPNFLVAPNLVDCNIEKEVKTISSPTHCELNGSLCIPPDTEHDSLIRAIDLHYADQLDNNFLEELNYGASLDANAFVQSLLAMDFTNKNEMDYAQHLSIKAEDIVEELGQTHGTHPTDTSETGIHIKERSIPTFNDAPVHRIRLQVHKTQAKNAGSTNHTVTLDGMNHRLNLSEPIEQEISMKFAACTLDSGPTIKKEIIFEEPPIGKHEESCNFNSKQWKLPSDRAWNGRCRPSIRGLARQVFRDARVRMRRYSPVSMNCLFLGGTCLTGAAFTGYIFEERV